MEVWLLGIVRRESAIVYRYPPGTLRVTVIEKQHPSLRKGNIHMKRLLIILAAALSASAFADHPSSKDAGPAVLMEGLGNIHHPVSTKNAEAQKFFNQGLRLIYAFNHDEALRSFRKAAELDPGL